MCCIDVSVSVSVSHVRIRRINHLCMISSSHAWIDLVLAGEELSIHCKAEQTGAASVIQWGCVSFSMVVVMVMVIVMVMVMVMCVRVHVHVRVFPCARWLSYLALHMCV